MQYYFIYSAGGGAGEWKAINKIWKDEMPEELKNNILLKFGDIFFNHRTSRNIIKIGYWQNNLNIRQWLYENVKDKYVLSNSNIILDSGTSKIVNFIQDKSNSKDLDTCSLIQQYKNTIDENNIVKKYVDVICDSNINYAVTFDIPNPYKIRGNNQISIMKRNILEQDKSQEIMDVTIQYANEIFEALSERIGNIKAREILMPIIDGKWNRDEYMFFLSKIKFKPKNIAIGGISGREIKIEELELKKFNLEKYNRVHFLGSAGLEKINKLKKIFGDNKKYSADVSTPHNRAIDGAKSGKKSGIYSYNDFKLTRITEENKEKILNDYKKSKVKKIYSEKQLKEIIDYVILHQEGKTSEITYENRARLFLINSDVFRLNAKA